MSVGKLLLPLLFLSSLLSAQGEAPIDDEALLQRIEQNAEILRKDGKLHPVDALFAEAREHRTCTLQFASPASERLPPETLCERARRSCFVVGHYYPCKECSQWHFTGATGFAVGADGVVATCWHLLAPDPQMPGACLCVADYDGRVWPVEAVLAADDLADICLLRIPRAGLVPLPLRTGVRAGERVWCFSNPDHQFGYFSEGLVARRYRLSPEPPAPHAHGPAPEKPAAAHGGTATARTTEWLHVTADFARGSSGAPILDACGNVVGIAQSTTTVVHDEETDKPETQMVSRSAVPAEALHALAQPAAPK